MIGRKMGKTSANGGLRIGMRGRKDRRTGGKKMLRKGGRY